MSISPSSETLGGLFSGQVDGFSNGGLLGCSSDSSDQSRQPEAENETGKHSRTKAELVQRCRLICLPGGVEAWPLPVIASFFMVMTP